MRRVLTIAMLTLLTPLLVAGQEAAVSPDAGGFFRSLYADHRAAQPGDILFVVVSESAMASQTTSRTNAKSGSAEVGAGAGWLDFIQGAGFGGSLSASASGASQRRNSLSTRIAVTVTGVTPAGTLTIEGERTVRVNHDLQTARLIGEVRPEDIRPDNSVLSEQIANATIDYRGPDPGQPGKRVGIITRVLGWLF